MAGARTVEQRGFRRGQLIDHVLGEFHQMVLVLLSEKGLNLTLVIV